MGTMKSQQEIDQATSSLTKFQRDHDSLFREVSSDNPVDESQSRILLDVQEKLGALEEMIEAAQQQALETRLNEVFSDGPPPTSTANIEAHLTELTTFSQQLDELLARLE